MKKNRYASICLLKLTLLILALGLTGVSLAPHVAQAQQQDLRPIEDPALADIIAKNQTLSFLGESIPAETSATCAADAITFTWGSYLFFSTRPYTE